MEDQIASSSLVLKIKFPTETKRISSLPTTFENLQAKVQHYLDEDLEFSLQYEDKVSGITKIGSNEDYSQAISSCKINNLKSLKIHVIIDHIQSIQTTPQIAKADEEKKDELQLLPSEQSLEKNFDLINLNEEESEEKLDGDVQDSGEPSQAKEDLLSLDFIDQLDQIQ